MIQGTASLEPVAEGRTVLPMRPRWLTAGVVYGALIVLCSLAGYWVMFRQFAPYDDEGFFDYTLKLFSAGHPLYSAVFSDYGPFYYELFGGLFAVIGHTVTTDLGRLIQLVLWIGASVGLGFAAHRRTGRLAIGVAVLATSFSLMTALTNEPMHAEALICALLTAAAMVVTFGLPRAPRASLCGLGAIAAALLLIKVNVGGYAIVSIAFAAVMTSGPLRRNAPLRRLVTVAFVSVGPAVMVKTLNTSWTQLYAVLAVLSAVSLVFVALPKRTLVAADDESARWPLWMLTGFAACLILVLGIVFALGTSPGALVAQIILLPTRQASALTTPIPLSGKVIWWSLAATVIAWTFRQTGRTAAPTASLWCGLLRALAGGAILLSLGNQFPLAIAPTAPFALAMPLAWVAALPTPRDSPGPREQLGRLLIPALAVQQCLLAYPVAGSQMYLGPILLVLCAAVCLADAWTELTQCNREPPLSSRVAASGLTALFTALALGTTFALIVQPLQAYRDAYRANPPLRIQGATRLHLPAPEAIAFEQAVAALRAHCRTVISLPGLYSFNLWSGLPTPSPLTGQPFWSLLSSAQQSEALAAAKASPGLCAVRNDIEAAGYGGGAPPPRVPLVAYIEDNFAPIARYGPYLIETRRP